MTSGPEATGGSQEYGVVVDRFARPVRWVHHVFGALMLVCLATAAILYLGPLAILIGHRYVVEQLHVFAGLALPVPLLVGAVLRSTRAEAGRLNRFAPTDWRWLRSRSRRDGTIEVGKFNAGQKLNFSLSLGATGALLVSGVVMYFTGLAPLAMRSGATFVHDWFALGLGLLVMGHLTYAIRDPDAMVGIRTGRVPLRWARREHAAWAHEVVGPPSGEVGPHLSEGSPDLR